MNLLKGKTGKEILEKFDPNIQIQKIFCFFSYASIVKGTTLVSDLTPHQLYLIKEKYEKAVENKPFTYHNIDYKKHLKLILALQDVHNRRS